MPSFVDNEQERRAISSLIETLREHTNDGLTEATESVLRTDLRGQGRELADYLNSFVARERFEEIGEYGEGIIQAGREKYTSEVIDSWESRIRTVLEREHQRRDWRQPSERSAVCYTISCGETEIVR